MFILFRVHAVPTINMLSNVAHNMPCIVAVLYVGLIYTRTCDSDTKNRRLFVNPKYSYLHTLSFELNLESHTTHIAISWPNPKNWLTIHMFDLMTIVGFNLNILKSYIIAG